ncbi:MAG: radical SAM protein, partial [Phycisphaerae bacterium]|nr:radical SAM protein [Phycisphaerae bacterium]
ELGAEVPWHVSRFHPDYESRDIPATPVEKLDQARQIGLKAGLRYVYCGNIPSATSESTFCHKCGKELIGRKYYSIEENNIKDGKCPDCGTAVAGKGMS